MTLDEVNALDRDAFVLAFGDIAEHSPEIAHAAFAPPYAGRAALVDAFQRALTQAPPAVQLKVLAAHPDLAGRAALSPDSAAEQAGAGLDRLTEAEMARFTQANAAYRARFPWPFIFAVRGADKHAILAAFDARLGGTEEEERLTALAQVCRIMRFRLEDRVDG